MSSIEEVKYNLITSDIKLVSYSSNLLVFRANYYEIISLIFSKKNLMKEMPHVRLS